MSLGKRIQEAREKKDISQRALAEKINMSNGSISRWEKDEVLPSERALRKVARALNVPVDWLKTETDVKEYNKYRELYLDDRNKKFNSMIDTLSNSSDTVVDEDLELMLSVAAAEDPEHFFGPDNAPVTIILKAQQEEIQHLQGVIEARVSSASAPVYGSIAAGTPIEDLSKGNGDELIIPEVLKEKHPNAFYLTVQGNSMNKLYKDGNLVLVDPDVPFKDGAICAVYINGYSATVKRMTIYDFGIALKSESYDERYKDKLYSFEDYDENYIAYIGTVIWSMEDYR